MSAGTDQQIYGTKGPWAFTSGNQTEVFQQIIDDFVTRRDVAMEAVQEIEDGNYFAQSLSTFYMQTGRTRNTNTVKHTFFQRHSRFRKAAMSNIGSPTDGLVTLTIDPAYVQNIGTTASPTWVSPGLEKQYVFCGRNAVSGQIISVSKPSTGGSKPAHTLSVQFESSAVVATLVNGDFFAFHANVSKEKDTFPEGESQTDARYDMFFQYMMTSRPEISMLANSVIKQYAVQGKFFEDLIAKLDTYVRHEIQKSIQIMIADGSSYNGRQRTVGGIAQTAAFGYNNLLLDLSTTEKVKDWLNEVARYARSVGMGNELTHFVGMEFKIATGKLLDYQGTATLTNARYDTFGGDGGADASKRAVKLGFGTIVDGQIGFTHHMKPVLEYGHPELMNTVANGSGLNASYYEKTCWTTNMGRGGDKANMETFGVDSDKPQIGIFQLIQRNGDGSQATRNEIFRGSDIIGYEASKETITETFGFQMTNPQKSMFFKWAA